MGSDLVNTAMKNSHKPTEVQNTAVIQKRFKFQGFTSCDDCGYEAENILDLKQHTNKPSYKI